VSSVAYFALPKSIQDTAILPWEGFDAELIEAAQVNDQGGTTQQSMMTANDGSFMPLHVLRLAYACLAMNTEQHPPLAYKLKDAAALLGVSTVSMRRAIQRGLIRPSRAFRHVLISVDELNRFLKSTSAIKQC